MRKCWYDPLGRGMTVVQRFDEALELTNSVVYAYA